MALNGHKKAQKAQSGLVEICNDQKKVGWLKFAMTKRERFAFSHALQISTIPLCAFCAFLWPFNAIRFWNFMVGESH